MLVMALYSTAMEILRWRTLVIQVWIALTADSWCEVRVRCIRAAYESFGLTGNIAKMVVSLRTEKLI